MEVPEIPTPGGAGPFPAGKDLPARNRNVWPRFDRDPTPGKEMRRNQVLALVLTFLLHLLAVKGVPGAALLGGAEEIARAPQTYEIELAVEEPPDMEFVQTNPEAPSNQPDETPFFAARDQQAAQEKPEPNLDDPLPTVEGDNAESRQVVEGQLEEPTPFLPPPSQRQDPNPAQESARPAEPSPPTPEQAARPEIRAIPAEEPPTPPAPQFIQQEPVSEEGPGSTSGPVGEAREIPEKEAEKVISITAPLPVEVDPLPGVVLPPSVLAPQNPAESGSSQAGQEAAEESPPTPRPRPRLQPNVVPMPLAESTGSASRMGEVAVDAAFSEFGDYMQRMVEAVSREWHNKANQVPLLRERPSRVKVRFTLDRNGRVHDLRVVDKTPNAGLLATGLCMDSIQSRSPYVPWTRDMVTVLGDEQELTFVFYYY